MFADALVHVQANRRIVVFGIERLVDECGRPARSRLEFKSH